jgi:NADH-quinone oxidoreductase subunit G
MAKITIDGIQVEVQDNLPIIEAAKAAGIAIPHYCYHPKLSIAANCRMCLVEIAGSPKTAQSEEIKLQPACQIPVKDGMVIQTKSPRVMEVQQGVMELLLLNHPVDCSVCDQSGECKLQDYYMLHSQHDARIAKQEKVHAEKAKQIGPHVYLDQERCVKCTRCVRFMDEVAHNSQLGMFARGNHSVIDTYPGQPLDDPYSMNVVDICPVGALTSADFRFNMRVWWLKKAPGVCTGCSRGCNTFVDHNNGQTYRIRPRDNDAVNQSWMCDEGRDVKRFNEARFLTPRVSGNPEEFAPALEAAAASLQAYNGAQVGIAISAQASTEEAYIAGLIARDFIGTKAIVVTGRPAGEADNFLRRADKNPNRAGVLAVLKTLGLSAITPEDFVKKIGTGELKAALLVGADLPSDTFAGAVSQLDTVVALASSDTATVQKANVALPVGTAVETHGTFVNEFGRLQKFRQAYRPRGMGREGWQVLRDLGLKLGANFSFSDVSQVFNELASLEGTFKGLRWSQVVETGIDLNAPRTAPAPGPGADSTTAVAASPEAI